MLLFAPRPQSFMIYKAERYDVKGRKYIGPPMKYYFSDMGLGNARLNFCQREVRSLNRVGDFFRKIVVVRDDIIPWHDEKGILYIGIEEFLLDEHAMDL